MPFHEFSKVFSKVNSGTVRDSRNHRDQKYAVTQTRAEIEYTSSEKKRCQGSRWKMDFGLFSPQNTDTEREATRVSTCHSGL